VGDREYYFRELEKKAGSLKSAAGKALFHRAKAAFLLDKGDQEGAAAAFEEALSACASEPDDEKQNNGIQACVTRADYIHLLCSQKKLDEAQAMLDPCEEYARGNIELKDGALLQLALEAGIHLALERGDEEGAIERIAELEALATSVRLADRIGGDLLNVANQCSHLDAHEAGLAAAQAAIRLGRRARDREGPHFLVGAFYTEAMVLMRAGQDSLALSKAEAILDFCNRPEDAPIKQATQHLIAEIKRLAGDSESAVELARQALREATGSPEATAFAKLALARALSDNGETEDALKHAREGWRILEGSRLPPEASEDFLSHIVNYASELGFDDEARAALAKLTALPPRSEKVAEDRARVALRADAITKMRERIMEILREGSGLEDDPARECKSVQEGNAAIIRPLLNWWDDVLNVPFCAAGAYEFWGRGNFVRVLENLRRFPRALNVTLEVRTLQDVQRAIRMWTLYADVLILIWKGPTESGWERLVVPESFFAEPGGHGYMVFLGTALKKLGSESPWFLSLGRGTTLPGEVALFLATEARPLVESGRLIVVPAVGAACVSPGHGVFEQMIAQAANAVPGIRSRTRQSAPIGMIPYSPDIPLPVLADLAESEADRLRKLRLLLVRRTKDVKPAGDAALDARALSLEIDDALSDMAGVSERVLARRGLEGANEPLAAANAHFKSDGRQLSPEGAQTPFAPLFVMQTLGYGWQVGLPDPASVNRRFEPRDNDALGTWLAPAEQGWTVPMIEEGENE
jgi:tetratricopeptide (TPR) repeat protein